MIEAAEFKPVYLEIGEVRTSEFGKRWVSEWHEGLERHRRTLRDVVELARRELWKWPAIQSELDAEGVPQAISSGLSQYAMSHLIDHVNGKTAFTMPAAVAMALCTAAPTSTSTGATITEANYTGYARMAIAAAGFNAATAATPSVATNAGAITFGNCTAGTSTLLGFALCDSATLAAGNMLWYGTLTSVTISTTQTPPTVGSGVMNLSMTGT
jgi:hypothetical protein